MSKHGKVKVNRFGRFYACYLVVIIALIAILFLNIRSTLVKYENSQPDNYVINLIKHAGKNDKALGSYLQEKCFGDGKDSFFGDTKEKSKEFYSKASKSKLEAKKDLLNSEENKLVYNISADGNPYVTVSIKKTGSNRKMLGLLSIDSYELDYAFLRAENSKKTSLPLSENGTLDYTIVIPEDFKISFGGSPIDIPENAEDAVIEDFESISQYPMVPKGKKISMELPFEPTLKVLNNGGEEVAVSNFAGTYYAAADYAEAKDNGLLSEIGDPVEMYKLWIRFTRMNDVPGSYYGLYTVKDGCRFLPGCDMDNFADNWASQVDILFVSDYNSYSFDAAEMKNFVKYNDKFCSVDVHIEESIDVSGVGLRTDTFDNRMFFIYNEDTSVASEGWYWVGQFDITGR